MVKKILYIFNTGAIFFLNIFDLRLVESVDAQPIGMEGQLTNLDEKREGTYFISKKYN
jgi:hypothetical protein